MKYEEMKLEQRKEIAGLFENWLAMYTETVINQVVTKLDEILNNEFAMNMLRELKEREDKEKEERVRDFRYILQGRNADGIHSHVLTHSESYRNVLYDMYIRNTTP